MNEFRRQGYEKTIKKMQILRLSLGSLLMLVSIVGCGSPKAPKAEVKSLIARSIEQLEAKDYEAVFKQLVSQEQLAELTKSSDITLDEVVAGFAASEKPVALLKMLKQAKDMEPRFNDAKDELVYEFDKKHLDEFAKLRLTFKLVDGKWVMLN